MGIANFLFKKNTIVFSWILSYVSILLIPVIISGFLYYESKRIIENEINNSNSLLLNQLQQMIDSELENVKRIASQLSMDKEIRALMYNRGPLNEYDTYRINYIVKNLKSVSVANSFIKDFYIYFKNMDFALTPAGQINPFELYKKYYSTSDIDYDNWYEWLKGNYYGEFNVINEEREIISDNSIIYFVESFPVAIFKSYSANIVIMLNKNRITKTISNLGQLYGGTVAISDNNNRILLSNNNKFNQDSLSAVNMESPNGLVYEYINNKHNVISYIRSQENEWKYLYILPVSVFMNKARYIQTITIIGIIFCMIIGLIAAYIFAKKNYNPVKELVQLFSRRNLNDGNVNEYGFIKESILNSLKDRDNKEKIISRQNIALKAGFISKLISGDFADSVPLNDILDSMNIRFISEHFAVIIVQIKKPEDFYMDYPKLSKEEVYSLTVFIIKNVIEELLTKKNVVYTYEREDTIICLVNFHNQMTQAEKEAELIMTAKQTRAFFLKEYSIDLTFAISEIHKSMKEIPEAYKEAVDTIEYTLVNTANSIMHYRSVMEQGINYYYPMEIEHSLMSSLKAGDTSKVNSILDELFEKNVFNSQESVYLINCFIYDLTSTIIKTVKDMYGDENPVYKDIINEINPILSSKSPYKIKNYIIELSDKICSYNNKNKKSHNTQLRDSILDFIKWNYNDCTLGLTSIADHFNISSFYLSSFFKEQTGESLPDYVNRLRLIKAKELLLNSDESINELSSKMGFCHVNTFIRVFKKHEGVTPGKYREIKNKK